MAMEEALDFAAEDDTQIHEIENLLLQGIFSCRSTETFSAQSV